MKLVRFALAILIAALPVSAAVLPQEDFDASIPTFRHVLGFDPGGGITTPAQVQLYVKALDDASDRVKSFSDGSSVHGRWLGYLCVSDPANLAQLDAVFTATRKVREAAAPFPPDQPVTVAICAAVHGDETSSVDAALSLAYYLAASKSSDVADLLRKEIVLIDPLQNPDGRARTLAYQETVGCLRALADPNAAEHSEFWPGGRSNGNFFDMNRDWYSLTQPETQTRVKRYLATLPQVFVDLHEMGGNSTYFFPPPTLPVNRILPPEIVKMEQTFGHAIASEFDRKGFAYFTEEIFDEFFPGYGSSWPCYNGTIGMTFEQAGVGGMLLRKSDGVLMTYEDAVERHFTSSLTTCRTSAAHRTEILDLFAGFYRKALAKPAPKEPQAYVFALHPALDRLVDLLVEQGVQVKRLPAPCSLRTTASKDSQAFPAGSAVIPLAQPSRFLVQAIMDPMPVMDPKFLQDELERKKHHLSSEIYDITGWSMPLCFNLAVSTVTEELPQLAEWKPADPCRLSSGPVYGYVIDYAQDRAVSVVAALIRGGYRVGVSEKPLVTGGHTCARGSYVVRTAGNPKGLREELQALLDRNRVQAIETATGLLEGSIDLGSSRIRNLRDPRIAILMESPVSPNSYGALKWLLGSKYGIDFTPLRVDEVEYADLRSYRTLVIPNASADSLKRGLGEGGLGQIRKWVEAGGTLVAIKGAAAFLLGEEFKLGGGRVLNSFKKDSVEPAPEKKKDEPTLPSDAYEPPGEIAGTLYRVDLDQLDWLSSGYAESVPVFVSGSLVIDWPDSLDRCVGRFAKVPKLCGFSYDIDDKRMEGKAYLARVGLSGGQVILFADEPQFRGYMRGLDRLLLNAVFNAPSYLDGSADFGR